MEVIRLLVTILAASFLPTVRKVSSAELSLTEIEKPGKFTSNIRQLFGKKKNALSLLLFSFGVN